MMTVVSQTFSAAELSTLPTYYQYRIALCYTILPYTIDEVTTSPFGHMQNDIQWQ